ncbi:hypothetical protein ACH5RR_015675 [Cinchona calisaya]|uniref:Uncharacterized protein n=1 Tax=Cinchona calisaya TaxID=153742 RepID=A0ABD2ZTS5_9GENT
MTVGRGEEICHGGNSDGREEDETTDLVGRRMALARKVGKEERKGNGDDGKGRKEEAAIVKDLVGKENGRSDSNVMLFQVCVPKSNTETFFWWMTKRGHSPHTTFGTRSQPWALPWVGAGKKGTSTFVDFAKSRNGICDMPQWTCSVVGSIVSP